MLSKPQQVLCQALMTLKRNDSYLLKKILKDKLRHFVTFIKNINVVKNLV